MTRLILSVIAFATVSGFGADKVFDCSATANLTGVRKFRFVINDNNRISGSITRHKVLGFPVNRRRVGTPVAIGTHESDLRVRDSGVANLERRVFIVGLDFSDLYTFWFTFDDGDKTATLVLSSDGDPEAAEFQCR